MIIESILELIYSFLTFIFSFIQLPGLPAEVQSIIDEIVRYMIDGVDVLGLFIDWNMLKILIPIVIVIVNLEKLIDLVMFILRKIPFLGIE